MFYAHFVLNKKGPLARIWLAAHWDKKLTRAHVFETNINSSVEAILEPKVKLALRTSGHLLLGVVRIYSRKAKYLLADCNEAFVKIKMSFRPGMVDLPEEANCEAAIAAITLPENIQDFEATIADLNELDVITTANQSRPEDITMREDLGEINLGRQDDDFGEEAASTFDDVSSQEVLRGADITGDLHLDAGGHDVGSHMSSIRGSRAGARESSLLSPGALPERSGRREERPDREGMEGDGDRTLTRDVDMESNGELDGGFLDAGGDDDDDDFGGAIDHDLFTDTELFSDPSAQQHLETITSEIESQIMGGRRADVPLTSTATPAVVSTTTGGHTTALTEQSTLLPNEAEAFALPPIDASSVSGVEVRSRGPKRKRRLIIDEQKSIPSEVMKVQMSDTSDITTQLDLAPPTKKLMHWKETGGVDQLLAMPGRAIPSRTLLRLFTRNLKQVTLALDADEDIPAGQQQKSIMSPRSTVGEAERTVTDDFLLAEGPGQHLFPGDTEMSVIGEASEAMQTPRISDMDMGGGQLRHDPFLIGHPPGHHDDDTGYMPPDTPYMPPPSVLSEAPPSVLQPDMLQFDRDLDDDDDGDLGGPIEGEEEAYEERRLEKRSKVMLRILGQALTLKDGADITFDSLCKGTSKKQAAAKFYTLLLLRKQKGVSVRQGEPFSEIAINRGSMFYDLCETC